MAFDYSIQNLQTTNDSPVDQQLDRLRQHLGTVATTKSQPNLQQLRTATQEFEALFVNYMLKVMRSTIEPADEEASSLGKDVYMSMFDQEISLNIARSQSLGVGEMLFKQLEGRLGEKAKDGKSEKPQGIATPRTPDSSSGKEVTIAPRDEESRSKMIPDREWFSPVMGRLSSGFGSRTDPYTQSAGIHKGIDIAAPAGTPIRAAQNGTVVFSGWLRGYGNTIILEHSDGYRTLYGHASRMLVGVGERVSADQSIGEVGETGRATGTHLHFELQKGRQRLDPTELLVASNRDPID